MLERPSFIRMIFPFFLQTLFIIKDVPSHLFECLGRVDHILKSESVDDSVELIVLERHLGHIADDIIVIECWKVFGHTYRRHVWTPVDHCQVGDGFVVF